MKRKTIITPSYVSDLQLAARFSVSRQTIWKWGRDLNFPKPIKLTEGCTRWLLSDVQTWENSRKVSA